MHASHLMPKAQVRIPPHKQARSSHPFTGGEKIAIPILVTGAAGCVGGVGRTVTELMHRVIAGCETMCFLMSISDNYLAAMVNTAGGSEAPPREGVYQHGFERREAMTDLEKVKLDMRLEVVVLGVSDVDRAKAFYENLGWRLDIDIVIGDGFRAVQMTPPNSEASIIFGKGVTSAEPGSVHSLVLAVNDIDAACDDLIARGVDVSEVFHFAGGPFNDAVDNPRVSGRDPQDRSYFSFASFADPDGNGWLLQEIRTRLPGREWTSTQARAINIATLAELLRETSEHHDHYEKTHAEHHWWDWYAPYLSARQNGTSPEEAAAAADRYMEEAFPVLRR